MNTTVTSAGAVPKRAKIVGLALGVLAFLIVLALPPFTQEPAAQKVAAVVLLMAIWWITEAVHQSVTALLPLALFPILGVSNMAEAAAPYADQVIFLFLGGFVLAAAMERCGLHRRAGLACVAAIGHTPKRLLLGIMIATAGISLWVSNTATTALMLPVALAVLAFVEDNAPDLDETSRHNLGASLMLGVAYAAGVGGLGTLIGSPGNALMAAYLAREHQVEVSFARYLLIGIPYVLIMLPACWAVLCWRHPVAMNIPDAGAMLDRERRRAGPMSKAEIRVSIIFALTALAWVFRPLIAEVVDGLTDAGIAIIAALALFLLPAGNGEKLAEGSDIKKLPWDVLLLFGGGLAMAGAISSSGLAAWLGQLLTTADALPLPAIVALLIMVIVGVTQLASNTATTATFLPVGGAIAIGLGADPLICCMAVMLAAGSDYMLPVGTPPSAMVYATGRMTLQDMFRAGLVLNIITVPLLMIIALVVVPLVFGR